MDYEICNYDILSEKTSSRKITSDQPLKKICSTLEHGNYFINGNHIGQYLDGQYNPQWSGGGEINFDTLHINEAGYADPISIYTYGPFIFVLEDFARNIKCIMYKNDYVDTYQKTGIFDQRDLPEKVSGELVVRKNLEMYVLVNELNSVFKVKHGHSFLMCGNIKKGYTVAHDVTHSRLNNPCGIDIFYDGILIADTDNHCFRHRSSCDIEVIYGDRSMSEFSPGKFKVTEYGIFFVNLKDNTLNKIDEKLNCRKIEGTQGVIDFDVINNNISYFR